MEGRRIAIVGGGLAGLTAAWALAREGAGVTVYEKEKRPGGRASTDELDGYRIDVGAQLIASMYSGVMKMSRDIGYEGRIVRVSGRDALWRDGRAHEVVYGSVASMATSGGLPFRTKMRLGTSYVPYLRKNSAVLDLHAPERAAEAGLDGESIATWGEREMDDAFIDSLVYPQLGAYYGSTPEETSAGFYHTLARDGMDVSLYAVTGGVGAISERLVTLVREAGGEVNFETPALEVEVGVDGVTVKSRTGVASFDALASAVPAPILLEIARGLPAELSEWLRGVRYRPFLSLALLLDRPLSVRYFGLSFPRGTTRNLAALAVEENKGVSLTPEGAGLLVAFPTPEMASSLMDRDSRDVLDAMLPEIAGAFPGIEARVIRARVYRWPVGTPVFFPGYLSHLAAYRGSDLEASSRIALAGDYLLSPSMEGAVVSGLEAAERLTRRLGAG